MVESTLDVAKMVERGYPADWSWHGIPLTPAVESWLIQRGYAAGPGNKKLADAESVIGPELAQKLEAAAARQDEIERRSMLGIDYSALIVRDEHGSTPEPRVNPASLLLENDDFQQALSLIEPLFENALSNIIQSQMSPAKVIEEASHIAHAAAPLKANALTVLAEASNLAKARLQANAGVNTQELERASVVLIEHLTKTHFPPAGIQAVSIGAREDGPEAFKALKDQMLALIEPSVSDVPRVTLEHLAPLVQEVVREIIVDNTPSEEPLEVEERTMTNIPQAEYGHTASSYNVTPRLRQMLRANEGLSPSPPAPATQLVQRSPTPVAGTATPITAERLALAVRAALVPIAADLNALKLRHNVASRTAQRRAMVSPRVSRQAVRAAVSGGPGVVIRTVESRAYGGLPTRRQVFSAAQVSRASYGLGLTERPSAPTRPVAFASRYMPSSTFPTVRARDEYDASFENKPVGVPLAPGVVERNLSQFPVL